MLKIYTFKEWQSSRTNEKSICDIQSAQLCCPSSSSKSCICHYDEYVHNALNENFKPFLEVKSGKS